MGYTVERKRKRERELKREWMPNSNGILLSISCYFYT